MDELIFNYTAHKELWTWLAGNPCKKKMDWPGWKTYGDVSGYLCFACDYDYEKMDDCKNCPLKWGNAEETCRKLYDRWNSNCLIWEATKIALQIANLPVKEGVKTI